MKKLFTLLFILSFSLLLGNQAKALYIWQDFDNPGTYPPAGWTITSSGVYTWIGL